MNEAIRGNPLFAFAAAAHFVDSDVMA